MEPIRKILAKDFDLMLGETNALDLLDVLGGKNTKLFYRHLDNNERDRVILKILNRIFIDAMPVAGKDDKHRWKKGWQENLDEFVNSGFDIEKLTPKFLRPNQPMRFMGDYIMPLTADLELNFYKIFRHWLFSRYLPEFNHIYEFGCGTCFNLAELARIYPEKKLKGLDWVSPSVEIAELLAKYHRFKIQGQLFDLLEPDNSIEIPPNSAVVAIGALEQLGRNFRPFINYLLDQNIGLFLHVDSIIELYNCDNLSDFLAYAHDIKRNYLNGYLPYIKELAEEGRIEILKCQKVSFGGLYHDGYSFDIWRPINKNRGRRNL